MPEPALRPRGPLIAACLVGAVGALAGGFGGVAAALGGWLAQPALALAVRGWRGRAPAAYPGRAELQPLLLAWGAALLGLGLLLLWPLSALRGGGVGAVLVLSAVVGLALIALWRTWPLWQTLERDGGPLAQRWRSLGESQIGDWRGLGVAAMVLALLAWVTVLAWPGLLDGGARWAVAIAAVFGWPLLHLQLQRTRAASPAMLPIEEFREDSDPDGGAGARDAAGVDAIDAADLDAALYAAARSGRVERALALLEAGADAHALPAADDRDRRSLAVLGAVLPDLRLLRALIARGVDVNAAHAGMTPLLAATRDSWHGRPEAVMTLLANGADPRASDADGNTPLHHAARSSDPGVAALLRDAAAELDARNHEGITPLGVACAAGNWRLARFLLERGARTEVEGGTPALLPAAGGEDDDAAGVQLLLKHKARVDARDARGRSALHEAARAGHADIVAALLAAGADVAARDAAGRTPLLDAAQGGRLAVVDALLAAHADPADEDAEGRGALALACAGEAPSPAIVRRLLELGADPERRDRSGRRAVDLAAEAGRWSLVAALDPGYPLPASVADGGEGAATAPDRSPRLLLLAALERQDAAALDPALARLLGAEELGVLLRDPAARAWPAGLDWLLAQGAQPELRGSGGEDGGEDGGDTALFALLREPAALASLQVLLRRGVSPAGAGGLARFLGACAEGDHVARGFERIALELLDRGADPFAPSAAGDPPLALAVRLGWIRLAERLIGCGVPLDARDSHGMSALHLAAALGRESALRALVARGANPDLRAADGQTPLGVALAAGRRDLADWLDWRGWPLPRRALQPADLPAAAIVGDADAVRRLLDLGFPIDTPDAQGCSALLRAAGGGHRAVVDLLLDRGADPQRAAHTGATPLSAAVSMRQGEIVERLLAAGADLEHRLPGEVTVLMLAAALGLPDLCARLLAAGANVQACDAQGLTPLHCAALYGFTARDRDRLIALLDTLLLAGAEPDAAAGNVTPLLLLLGARAEPGTACDEDVVLAGLQRLLDEGVAFDARDPRGFGPLHLSALHGLLQVTRFLLRAGADPELRDGINRVPREIAVMRGFVDVAGEFEPGPSGVSMARFLREPRSP